MMSRQRIIVIGIVYSMSELTASLDGIKTTVNSVTRSRSGNLNSSYVGDADTAGN